MASNDVNLGTGKASGHFYHAVAGTALPAHPLATLDSAWKAVGYVSDAGITWHHGRSATLLKDWSNTIRRQIQDDPTGTVTVPIISTTKESMTVLFGSGAVSSDAATSSHGALTTVVAQEGAVSGEEAFLFIMQDGDDTFMLGTTNGYVTTLDDVSFAPNAPITWNATVSAGAWTFMKDDGQTST